jgi:type IV secretory pathway VirB2 component (pilin)
VSTERAVRILDLAPNLSLQEARITSRATSRVSTCEFQAQVLGWTCYPVAVLKGATLWQAVASCRALRTVFGAPDGSLDPTIDGPLAQANMLAHGPIKRLLTAIYLFAAGHAALRAELLPASLRRAGYLIALINLAFVPSSISALIQRTSTPCTAGRTPPSPGASSSTGSSPLALC